MTIDDAILQAAKEAASLGFSYAQFKMLEPDLREMLYTIGEDLDQTSLDNLLEKLF
jgi:hypothetical protein